MYPRSDMRSIQPFWRTAVEMRERGESQAAFFLRLHGEGWFVNTLLQDLRYCARQLIKAPGFSLTAIVSLTLGIGATTAVFSVIYAILMNPYPYAAPDRMIHMRLLDPAGHEGGSG